MLTVKIRFLIQKSRPIFGEFFTNPGRPSGKLKEWADGDISLAAPLAKWGEHLFPDVEQRHQWLHKLARETVSTREVGAIVLLLRTFQDDETKHLAEDFLENPNVWYYHRVTLQGLYARAFPGEQNSLEILEKSLSEIDGPNPGSFAESFQVDTKISSRLLAAAVSTQVDVRMAVASVLRERAVDYDLVVELTPEVFAEANSAVRASCVIARARAGKNAPEAFAGLIESLISELGAAGHYTDVRRRTALAGLLELGAFERIASAFAAEKSPAWIHCLAERLDRDPVSIGTVIEHWKAFQPLLEQYNLPAELPLADMVHSGYEALLERDTSLQQALDRYFEAKPRDFIDSAYLDAFARRQPRSTLLRSMLLQLVCGARYGDIVCTAARSLAEHFSSDQDIWLEISPRLGKLEEAAPHLVEGVLGYLALGWPEGTVAAWVRALDSHNRAEFSARDRMLFAVLLKDPSEAEAAVVEIMSEPLESWRYRKEDTHALRRWAETEESVSSLAKWVDSDNPSLSITAISLIADSGRSLEMHIDQMLERFDAQLKMSDNSPQDGLNAATAQKASWAVSVYSTLKAAGPSAKTKDALMNH